MERMGEDTTGRSSRRHVSVDEAARELGLSIDAVRKRVQRGTIEHEKDAAGRVHILLDSPDSASTVQDHRPDTTGQMGRADALIDAKDETISELRERVKRLEHELDIRNEEVRRRDHLLAAALERIPPQLEAPQEPQDPQSAPESAESQSARVETPQEPEKATERRSFWGRLFSR